MSHACIRHPMTFGNHLCSECGHRFCDDCVVYPYGTKRAGLCIKCALDRAGVRKRRSDMPKLSRKSVRARLKEDAAHAGETAKVAEATDETDVEETTPWIGESTSLYSIPGAWSETFS
ncbi:MAG: hypothetical protein R2735_07830 [Microthrixaceae bacterium]